MLANGGVMLDYAYGSGFFLANGADELVLLDGLLREIDRVEWDGGPTFPDPNGASMALLDPLLDNNVGANWVASTAAFGDGDLGTPGNPNFGAPPGDAVPEPVTTSLVLLGLTALGMRRRRLA